MECNNDILVEKFDPDSGGFIDIMALLRGNVKQTPFSSVGSHKEGMWTVAGLC